MPETNTDFFQELRQRNVFRVGAAYVVVAWLIAQVAELALDSFDAPAWVIKAVLISLAAGLPIAVFFAWAYELTPDGIKRESEVDRSESITGQTGRKLNYLIIGALTVALAYFVANHDWSPDTAATADTDVSIAVLPFADLSEKGDQEFFSDGIAEEILNVLVRIPELKVAGRTSSFSFKGSNDDLQTIGATLGVNHILEGSVRRSGERLRITAQLIRSDDGFNIWTETFDRRVADIFDIQDEIAGAVAMALASSLNLAYATPSQQRTDDIEVYEDYLKAKQLFLKRGKDNLDQALLYLNQATARDPEYSPAWSLIAAVYAVYDSYVENDVAQENYRDWHRTGKLAAERALTLQPDAAFAHAILGNLYSYDFDWIKTFRELDRAVELAPDDAAILDIAAQNMLDVGYFQEANALSRRAVAIDPLAAIYRNTLGRTYTGMNDPEQALTQYDKAMELDPSLPFPYRNRGELLFDMGDGDALQAHMEDAVAAENTTREEADWWLALFALRNDQQAMRAFIEDADRPFAMRFLDDIGPFMTLLSERTWQQESRRWLGIFGNGRRTDSYTNALWQAQVRKDGILDLWQSRGFPQHCRAVGDDDFECR